MVSKDVARGIGAHSRSKSYHRRGLWAIKKKNGGKFPVHAKKEKAAESPAKVPSRITLPFLHTLILSVHDCTEVLEGTQVTVGFDEVTNDTIRASLYSCNQDFASSSEDSQQNTRQAAI